MLLGEISDGVGVITLNRPERRNALAPAMYPAARSLLDRFRHDADVGCVLLTGSGTTFCSGGDIKDVSEDRAGRRPPPYEERVDGLLSDARLAQLIHEHPKLVVAALPGPAVGAGLALALACDLRIAAERATLFTGWARLALAGDFGGSWFLTRLVGPARALELMVDNEPIDARRAADLGLVNRVVGDDELPDAAHHWARRLASGPTTAYRYMKENIRTALRSDLATALPAETANMIRSSRTQEHGAAVRAWIEDRPR